MAEYALYLESGPKRRKTMVHVLDLLGCMATGPTTEDALAATSEAIRAYLRFLHDIGELSKPLGDFTTRVEEHITEGLWLGNGSPYVTFAPNLLPVGEAKLGVLIRRLLGLRERLAAWAESQDDDTLDAEPVEGSRTARSILLHVLGTPGAYLSPVLGPLPGHSRNRNGGPACRADSGRGTATGRRASCRASAGLIRGTADAGL
jgi:predicted RNase H-like HicB family nuclease